MCWSRRRWRRRRGRWDAPLAPRGPAAPAPPRATLNPACDDALGGVEHTEDSIKTAVTWSRSGSPHRVNHTIYVEGSAAVLTVSPGVVVCFGGNGAVTAAHGARMVMDGLDTAEIVLTARDPASPWFGIHFLGYPASASSLKHVRVEYTGPAYAVSSYDWHSVQIDSSTIRQTQMALSLLGHGSLLAHSRVDTTTNASYPAVEIGPQDTYEETTISGAAGPGLFVDEGTSISLLGGRIEGSGGVGLTVYATGVGLVVTRPIRVVGGASYGAEMVVSAFPRIYPNVVDQDSLLGNAKDTVVITGGVLQQFAYPIPALPWRVTGEIVVQGFGILRPSPGATLTFTDYIGITARSGGRVVAHGTAASPIVFTAANPANGWGGLLFEDSPSLASYLTNVRIEYSKMAYRGAVDTNDGHVLVIDSAVVRQSGFAVALRSPGSSISRSRVDTTIYTNGVTFTRSGTIQSTLIRGSAGPGLAIYSASVQVLSCEIRGSGGAGIELGVAVDVHNCNLVGNTGPGIANLDTVTANVENNWWGDTAGPTGPAGDGASGALDYTPWRTAAYVLPYVP